MNITPETATNLGNKLASLDLTNEEAALLQQMIGDESEVSGFSLDKSSTKGIVGAVELARPLVRGPIDNRWSFDANNAALQYTEVEW